MPTFLSDEWFAAAQQAQADLEQVPRPSTAARINFLITGAPFGDADIQAHLDTTDGLSFGAGHLDNGDVTITLPYTVAESVLVKGDSAAAMQAFMGGQMQIAGDMMKAMTLQTALGGPDAAAYRDQLAAITD